MFEKDFEEQDYGQKVPKPKSTLTSGYAQCGTKADVGHAYDPNYLLNHTFTYHPASDSQLANYAAIRSAAKHLAEVILTNTPQCADRAAAIRKLREAVMTANAAIATGGDTI